MHRSIYIHYPLTPISNRSREVLASVCKPRALSVYPSRVSTRPPTMTVYLLLSLSLCTGSVPDCLSLCYALRSRLLLTLLFCIHSNVWPYATLGYGLRVRGHRRFRIRFLISSRTRLRQGEGAGLGGRGVHATTRAAHRVFAGSVPLSGSCMCPVLVYTRDGNTCVVQPAALARKRTHVRRECFEDN